MDKGEFWIDMHKCIDKYSFIKNILDDKKRVKFFEEFKKERNEICDKHNVLDMKLL